MGSLQLTDPDIAVYRPWVWINFKGTQFNINYPSGVDQKFRWLKEFRWFVGQNSTGSSLEFVIFEDRAGWNYVWPAAIANSVMDAKEDGNTAYFQWGWSARGVAPGKESINRGITLETGGTAPSFASGLLSSRVHSMLIKKLDTEYSEGGINYRITGADPIASADSISKFDGRPDRTFKEAVNALLLDLEQKGSLPPGFAERTLGGFTPEFEKEFAIDVARRWPDNGFPVLMTIQKWTSELQPKNNSQRKDSDKVAPCIIPDTLKGKERLVFTTSTMKGQEPLFDIHVNPPDGGPLGTGKHTAINIRPNIASNILWAMFPQISMQEKNQRSIQHNENAGEITEKGEQGVPAEVASPVLDDACTPAQKAEGMRSTTIGAGNSGSLYVPISMEVELLGMPELDDLNYLTKYVNVILWNTAFIDDDLKWKREARVPSIANNLFLNKKFFGNNGFPEYVGLYDKRFSGKYLLSGITHHMTDGGSYTTTLKLNPSGEKSDINDPWKNLTF